MLRICYKNTSFAPRRMSMIGINLFHILVISPFFLYIAYCRGLVPSWVYQGLVALGLLVLVYHSYKVMVLWRASSPNLWINLIHVFFVAPLLLFIGKSAYDTPRWAFEVLALEAFAALGYHTYRIVLAVQDMKIVSHSHVVGNHSHIVGNQSGGSTQNPSTV